MSEPGVISIERMERPLKWLLVSFMGIVSLGCLCASVFAMHESALVCQSAASCEVVRRLVPGLDVGAHLPPLARASTQLSGNPRGTYASELVLEYATGETDVFDGVGPRGERAEEVAAQLNQAIHGGPWQPAYQLRERSLPIALVMLTLAVGALAFIAFSFSRLQVSTYAGMLILRHERWPLWPREHHLPLGLVKRFVARTHATSNRVMYPLWLEAEPPQTEIELGTGSANPRVSNERVARLNQWLSDARTHTL